MNCTNTTNKQIYLDYNSTTPCDPRVVEVMYPFFSDIYGNPANGYHILGRKAALAVEIAREQVASLLKANPNEIFFTSGATESNHLAILGSAYYAPTSRRKVITCAIEHKSNLAPFKRLQENGFEVIILPVETNGRINLEELEKNLDQNTFLVSIQAANNEIGTLQPIDYITELSHHYGAIVHTDAAQAVGKIPTDVNLWKVDILSFSSHKIYGPKGVGATYIKGGKNVIPIRPILEGGNQESGIRAGTLNVPAIVGFGKACEIAYEELPSEHPTLQSLRDELEKRIYENIPNIIINACNAPRLPNTSSITFEEIEADILLLNLPNLMMSTGSACNSGTLDPSHVLQAIGLSRAQAFSTIRISLGRMTTSEDINIIINQLNQLVIRFSSSKS